MFPNPEDTGGNVAYIDLGNTVADIEKAQQIGLLIGDGSGSQMYAAADALKVDPEVSFRISKSNLSISIRGAGAPQDGTEAIISSDEYLIHCPNGNAQHVFENMKESDGEFFCMYTFLETVVEDEYTISVWSD